jgi:hypothetical protein
MRRGRAGRANVAAYVAACYELPPAERRNVRTVFKQRPLAMHRWARHAALISICASLQGGDTFWRLERFLFANQATIRADNLDEKVETFGSQTGPSLDLAQLRSCLFAGGGVDLRALW